MEVTTERLEDCQVNVIIEMDAAETDKRLRQTARTISRQFNVPGYRRGKAPFAAIVRTFGWEAIQQQAIEDWGQELYEEAIEEIEYEPYQVGELQDVEWDPFRMTVLLPIPPEVDLGDYRSVRVPYEVDPVTEEQIDEYLAGLQQEHAQWVPVERPAAMGDQVVLDLQAAAGEVEIMNNQEQEMLLEANVGYPLPGFQEEVVGMSAGDGKTFTLMVPEDDDAIDAAGKEATVSVLLHSVKEKDLPPLDDDLALLVGDYDTLDDLKAGAREQMEVEALQRAEGQYLDAALEAFIEAATNVEYPPQAVDREAEATLNQMESNLASSGIQLDTYLGMLGKTRAAYKEEIYPNAEERLKKRLILAEIAKAENLQIEDDEIEVEIERMIEMMGPQAEEMRDTLESPGGRFMIMDDLMTNKAQERAMQIAKGEAPPLELADADDEDGADDTAGTEDKGAEPATDLKAEAGAVEEEAAQTVTAPAEGGDGTAATAEEPAESEES
jgi:trigger factor